MYCNQCEQTAQGVACTTRGVCGKQPDVAALQDVTVYALRGLALIALEARRRGIIEQTTDTFTAQMLFSTLTNVNFDAERFIPYIHEIIRKRNILAAKADIVIAPSPADPRNFTPATSLEGIIAQGKDIEHPPLEKQDNPNIQSLKDLLLYGMKGLAAYADHAAILGKTDGEVFTFLYRGLAAGYDDIERDIAAWIDLVMECGRVNLRAMELLDEAHTSTYGNPTPTPITLGHRKGKCILVSGHDLCDLHALLKQTDGLGIDIYTHGEMLPAHGYPELKKYPHFYGHYGTAWQNQHKEFPDFPGAILFTTNCIQKPHPTYAENVFTTGLVGWPGITHCPDRDFTPVIQKALSLPGFTDDVLGKTITTGFGHNAVLCLAPVIIDAVRQGKLKHFFLVGGCDGAKPGRNYYTEFVEKTPHNTVVLTLACGKFRFFDKDLGSIESIPRLIDMGQCNDAFSAIKVVTALAEAFECGVNELPVSLILSWYEQKAVAILLTLLALGITDIRLGPSLPAFVTPDILEYLVTTFNIKPITTPDEDLKAILEG